MNCGIDLELNRGGIIELDINAGVKGDTGDRGLPGFGGVLGKYGSFFDSTDQVALNTVDHYPVAIGTTAESNGVTIVDGSKITFEEGGTYSITYSIQFNNTEKNVVHDVDTWLVLNGTYLESTNSVTSVPASRGGNPGKIITTVDYLLTLEGGDYLQLFWHTDSTNVSINTIPDGSIPDSPSIIVTVKQVMYTQMGNGIENIVVTPDEGGNTITVNFTDGITEPVSFSVANGTDGVSITSITKVDTIGLVDTYEIVYSTGSRSYFFVTNGAKGDKGDAGDKGDDAVINGVKVLNIVEGVGIDATQVGDTLTISAPDSHAPHSDDQDLSGLVPKTTTVNGKALNGNISLDYSDVGAEPAKGADDNYVTDTEKSALHTHSNKTAIDNVSGTNTGDETDSTIKTKLGITTLSGSNTGDETNQTIKDKLGTDLTGKIPYTGATTDTDLGTKNLTTTGNITGNLRGGAEVTVANKNKYYPLVSDIVGNIIAKRFTYYWDGSTYVADYSNGFGNLALRYNTGANSNGFGFAALTNNTGSSSNGFGTYALQSNAGFSSNGFGYAALYNNTGANSNGFGHYALRYAQKSSNTAVGNNAYSAFIDNTSGNKTTTYTNVNDTTDRITLTSHGFGATNAYVNIKYASTTGTAIGGLTVGNIYQIKIIDANTIGFYEGSRGTNITSQGTGDHTFTPQYAYTNTTCLGANTSPTADNQVVLGDANVTQIKLGAGTSATQIVQEATFSPTLQNTFTTHLSNTVEIWKDSNGNVHIEGSVSRASGTFPSLVFTLPTGYRPVKNLYIPTVSADTSSQIRILTDGTVTIQYGINTWTSLTLPTFKAV